MIRTTLITALTLLVFMTVPTIAKAAPATPIMDGITLKWQRDTSLAEAPTRYDVRIHCSEDCDSTHTSTVPITGSDQAEYSYPVTWTYNDRVLRITVFAFDGVGSIVSSYPTVTYTNPNYYQPPPPPPTPGAPTLGVSGKNVSANWTAYPGANYYSVEVCGNPECTPYSGESQLFYTNNGVLNALHYEHQTATVKVYAHDSSNSVIYAYPHASRSNPNFGNNPTPQPVATTTVPTSASNPTTEENNQGQPQEVVTQADQVVDTNIEENSSDSKDTETKVVEQASIAKAEDSKSITQFIRENWVFLAASTGGAAIAVAGGYLLLLNWGKITSLLK